MSVFLRLAFLFAVAPLFVATVNAQPYFSDCAFKTGRSANLIIPASIEPTVSGRPITPGSELAVFTPDGVCAGRVTWTGKNVAMTIWGNDILTSRKDGMNVGDTLQFYLWDPEQKKLFAGPDLVRVGFDGSREYYRREKTFVDGAIFRLTELSVDTRRAAKLVAPADGIEVPDGDLKLSWAPVDGADRYRLQVSESVGFGDLLVDAETDMSEASIDVDKGVTYYWRIGVVDRASTATTWSETFTFTTNTVARKGRDEMVNGFLLEQNYPNPFNPSTTIPFQLEEGGEVSLRIYNMLGQEVATLVDGHLSGGMHEVRWHAGDLPSGMYLYRLVRGRHTQSRTLTLIK